jgi:ribosomal protein S18 acetylase RimI-like enzyme
MSLPALLSQTFPTSPVRQGQKGVDNGCPSSREALALQSNMATTASDIFTPHLSPRFASNPVFPGEKLGLKLTKGEPSDLEDLIALTNEIEATEFGQKRIEGKDKGPYLMNLRRAVMLPGSHLHLVRNEADKVVGAAMLNRDSLRTGSKKGYISNVYLQPQYRGQGLGRWLMNDLIDRGKALGYDVITLQTHNPAAKGLYESIGFKPYEVHKDGEVHMRLNRKA